MATTKAAAERPTDPNLPKSMCGCGHTGDGPNGDHKPRFAEGHGACTVAGCTCRQFTWARWLTPAEISARYSPARTP